MPVCQEALYNSGTVFLCDKMAANGVLSGTSAAIIRVLLQKAMVLQPHC